MKIRDSQQKEKKIGHTKNCEKEKNEKSNHQLVD